MAVIYGKKLVQLVRIKSETVKHLYEQMHILSSCMSGSTCTESLRYWWREKCGQRCEIRWYHTMVLWFQKSVFWGMPKSVYADTAASLITALCPEHRVLPLCAAQPWDTSASGSASFSLGNTLCSVFLLYGGRELNWNPLFPLQLALLLSLPTRMPEWSSFAESMCFNLKAVTQNQGSIGR